MLLLPRDLKITPPPSRPSSIPPPVRIELRSLTALGVHTRMGDRKGSWSLSVTRNRRLTFRVDSADHEICDLNLEDYP